jgi:hypothetical protein
MSSTVIPIVFIHIGGAPPDYARIAVKQARSWNPSAPIIFLCTEPPAELYGVGETWVTIDTVPRTPEHDRFNQTTPLDMSFRNGFWRFTTERLFVLYDWITWKGVTEFVHLENDNTLYYNISELLPAFRSTCKGISAPFQGEAKTKQRIHMCYSILYCNKPQALADFMFFLAAAPSTIDEMQRGGEYWMDNDDACSFLPVIPCGARLVSERFRSCAENPAFPCAFDAMAYGQYLGGEDPRNGERGPGFINEDAEFRADQFAYIWKKDAAERLYPLVIDKDGKQWPLANLHIHSKRLQDFI